VVEKGGCILLLYISLTSDGIAGKLFNLAMSVERRGCEQLDLDEGKEIMFGLGNYGDEVALSMVTRLTP